MNNDHIDWANFLKDYGGHILAAIALAQVWLIGLWKKYIRISKIHIHPTANIEVGFSSFGPTIGLLGTLQAQHDDAFINNMKVKVIRVRDKAEHVFGWKAFRPNEITLGSIANIQLHIASGFLVTPKIPKQYNIIFSSDTFQSDHQAAAQSIKTAWSSFIHNQPDIEVSFANFIKTNEIIDFHTQLGSDFFWRCGDFEVQLMIEKDTLQTINMTWKFSISQKDEADLRLNSIAIIRDICGISHVYNFAYKSYIN